MKTEHLIKHYKKILSEQAEELPEAGFDSSGGEDMGAVTDVQDPEPQEEMPLTSEGEEQYIQDLIDAALYEPSSEDAKTLTDLQGIMSMKKFTNAREEILPIILKIIRPATEDNSIRNQLNNV